MSYLYTVQQNLQLKALGLKGQNYPIEAGNTGIGLTAQRIQSFLWGFPAGLLISNLHFMVTAPGATPANLNHFRAGIYSLDGLTNLASSTDDVTRGTSAGKKTFPMTTPYRVPAATTGFYVSLWSDQSAAGGTPAMLRGGSNAGQGDAIGSGAKLAVQADTVAAWPATINLGTANGTLLWFAWS